MWSRTHKYINTSLCIAIFPWHICHLAFKVHSLFFFFFLEIAMKITWLCMTELVVYSIGHLRRGPRWGIWIETETVELFSWFVWKKISNIFLQNVFCCLTYMHFTELLQRCKSSVEYNPEEEEYIVLHYWSAAQTVWTHLTTTGEQREASTVAFALLSGVKFDSTAISGWETREQNWYLGGSDVLLSVPCQSQRH